MSASDRYTVGMPSLEPGGAGPGRSSNSQYSVPYAVNNCRLTITTCLSPTKSGGSRLSKPKRSVARASSAIRDSSRFSLDCSFAFIFSDRLPTWSSGFNDILLLRRRAVQPQGVSAPLWAPSPALVGRALPPHLGATWAKRSRTARNRVRVGHRGQTVGLRDGTPRCALATTITASRDRESPPRKTWSI